jgi:DNA-binding GntR family transcriptional regulator
MQELIPSSHTTKKELGVEAIRDAIISGRLKPGQRLLQDEIATQLRMSVTPVREALKQLEAEGLLVYEPHRGVRVADFCLDDAAEIYRIRGALEALAIRLATPQLDDSSLKKLAKLVESMGMFVKRDQLSKWRRANAEFHRLIICLSGSRRLSQVIEGLQKQFPWGHFGIVPGRPAQAQKEHEAILEALCNRDAQAAAELMQQHREAAADTLASLTDIDMYDGLHLSNTFPPDRLGTD